MASDRRRMRRMPADVPKRNFRASLEAAWIWLKRKLPAAPFFGAATAIVGAVGAFLGSIYTDEIRNAWPFYWHLGDPMSWHAALFWLLLVLFGGMYAWNAWALAKENQETADTLKAQIEELEKQSRTLPPKDFLSHSARLLDSCSPLVVGATKEDARLEDVKQGILAVLSSLTLLTQKFAAPRDEVVYSTNIMAFRSFEGLEEERRMALVKRATFAPEGETGAEWCGVLELLPSLSLFLDRDEISAEGFTPVVLHVPKREHREVNGNSTVLPGAAEVYCSGQYLSFSDTAEMTKKRPGLDEVVAAKVRDYFASGEGRAFRSFVSIALAVPTKDAGWPVIGVVNINANVTEIVEREKGVGFLAPLAAPYRLLLAGLLQRYLKLEEKEPKVKS